MICVASYFISTSERPFILGSDSILAEVCFSALCVLKFTFLWSKACALQKDCLYQHISKLSLMACGITILLFDVVVSEANVAFLSGNCAPPVAPRNGSLESYSNTIEGSEVFYSCDPDHLPDGRMRAVCTGNGWNPNPADLSCTIGMM